MIILNIILLFLGGLFTAIYLYYKHQFRYWKNRGFPHAEASIPFGSISGMGSTKPVGHSVDEIYKAFPEERFVGMWMFFGLLLLIRDPELVKNIFVRDFLSFKDRGLYVNEKDDPLSAHLFSIGGAQWRNMRVKMSPTFTSGKMKMMLPIMVECSKRFKKILNEPAERQEVIEAKEYSARFTTEIISLAAFGLDTDSLHNPEAEFRQYGKLIFEQRIVDLIRTFFQSLLPRAGKFLRLKTNRDDVSEFFLKAFKESMEYRETNNIRRNDFMDLLIQLKNKGQLDDVDGEESDHKDGTKFTFYEAAAQAFVFFAAGFETSSTTMQFALYELSKNTDVQQRLREEILEVLKKHGGDITYEAVQEMSFLARVIDETLRLYPPVPFLQRECNKEYNIPGTDLTIEKGMAVLIDILGLHHDPQHFPDPEKFDPDRFLEENKAQRHHYSYLPFGEGPRNCIGMRFGLMQSKVGLITLLSSYKFNTVDKTPIPLVYDPKSFILSPKEGMHLQLSKI